MADHRALRCQVPLAVNTGNTVTPRYLLEDLRPQTTYHLRFAARNRVGFSKWGAQQQVTTGRRGRPEPPVLNTGQGGEGGEEGQVVRMNTSSSLRLSWQVPEDNGLPIDHFLVQHYQVSQAFALPPTHAH